MTRQRLLSICIPTNGNVQWVIPVLESIYMQNVDHDDFEVIITDNGITDELERALSQKKYSNLYYERTNAIGFLNIVNSLQAAKGLFCKLHNHRSCLLPNMLEELLLLIKEHIDTQPIVYCANGLIRNCNDLIECDNFNTFVGQMSYWSSYMAGICIWHKDIPQLEHIQFNKMFPNTSILFEMRQQSKYIIWNKVYEKQLDGKGKGCYNLFYTFGVVFLDMLSELRMRDRITVSTFLSIKHDLFKWLCGLYYSIVVCKSDKSFDLTNIRQSIKVYFSTFHYLKILLYAYVIATPKFILYRVKRFLSFFI